MNIPHRPSARAAVLFVLRGFTLATIAIALSAFAVGTTRAAKPNQAPSVSITSPVGGATFVAGATVTLSATASDSDGTVTKVEFYRGGTTLIGTTVSSPYTVQWPNVPAGSYSLTAVATDNFGATRTSAVVAMTVTPPANMAPSVAITSPSSGAAFTAPATITISAAASDSDGTISTVEFYQGSTLIGTSTAAPYSVTWADVGAGSYSLTAKASDNAGATKVSAVVGITVGASNRPPLVVLTAPDPCMTYDEPAAIVLNADAVDTDGAVSRVDFLRDSTVIATAGGEPYTATWTNVPAGTYVLAARATDNRGGSATSVPVTITVRSRNARPSVVLTAPVDNAVFNAPASIALSANATDSDGTIAKVEFLVDGVMVGVATSAPHTHTWMNPGFGTHQIVARATDNAGGVADSAAVRITVNAPPVARITSPVAGASFVAPASISIAANATSSAGVVTRLDFFDGSTLIGSVNANASMVNATFDYTNVPAGSHSLSVKVTDSAGLSSTSGSVSVTVNAVPSVVLSEPANGATFGAPATINLAATADIAFGAITKVEFFSGTTLLGTSAAAPYRLAWSGVGEGSYVLTAKATSSAGLSSASNPVSVSVNTIDLSITAPAANTIEYGSQVVVTGSYSGTTVSTVSVNGIAARIGNSTFAAVVPLQLGVNVIDVVASTSLGQVTRSVTLTRAEPTIRVTNITAGQTVHDDSVTIAGVAQAPANSAVAVNGRLAAIAPDGRFFVNNVPLVEGANTIVVGLNTPALAAQATSSALARRPLKAVDPPGTSIQLLRNGAAPFALELDTTEGVAPLTVNVHLKNRLAYVYDDLTIDANGDGHIDYAEDGLPIPILERNFTVTYDTPGVYPLTLTLTRQGGSEVVYTATRLIHVRSAIAGAEFLREIFSAMRRQLTAGDISGSLQYLTNTVRNGYRDAFTRLEPVLPLVAEEFGTVESASIYDNYAELSVLQDAGDGPYRFSVLLIRDSDGIWRIDGM
jgi:hypothetical protein